MTKREERSARCTDLQWIAEMREYGYKSPKVTAAVLNVPYALFRRVINSQPVTAQDLGYVRMAWAQFSPEAVKELAHDVLGEGLNAPSEARPTGNGGTSPESSRGVPVEDKKALYGVLLRLLMEAER